MPRAKPQYPPAFKAEAVRLLRSSGRSISQIAQELGVSATSLRNRVKQAQIDQGERQGLTTEKRQALGKLRKENNVLHREREILTKSSSLLRQGARDLR